MIPIPPLIVLSFIHGRKPGDRRDVPSNLKAGDPGFDSDTWGCMSVSVTDYPSRTPLWPDYETRRFASEEYQIAMAPF